MSDVWSEDLPTTIARQLLVYTIPLPARAAGRLPARRRLRYAALPVLVAWLGGMALGAALTALLLR